MTTRPRITLTPLQTRLLLGELEKKRPAVALAAHLMVYLGLRLNEARLIEYGWLHDLGTPAARLTIPEDRTKTKWPRELPIPAPTHAYLQHFIVTHHLQPLPAMEPTSPLIVKRDGHRYTSRGIQKSIAHAAVAAIGFAVRPHALRHTFATALLKHTNLRVIQAALGHRSIKSTQIYTHPGFNDLRDALDRTWTPADEVNP